jgi:GT2 family glycosyltransferase
MRLALSVVIPVRDGGAWLVEQLDAVLADEDPGLEVVVADDGSTDGTPARVAARAAADPRVRLVRAGDGRGPAATRNAGAAAATHDAIAFCDADDVVGVTWTAAMAAALEHHPLVAGPLEYDRLNPAWAADVRGRSLESGFLFLGGAPRWPYPFGCNLGVRRDAWRAVGGFDETFGAGGEDVDLAWRLRRVGVEPVWVPAAFVHYRCRQDPRDIYRQARGYGAGMVRLWRRYARDWPEPPRAWGTAEATRRAVLLATRHVRDRRTLGDALFQLGWHAGVRGAHRQGRTNPAAAVPPPAPPAGPPGPAVPTAAAAPAERP